MRFGSVCSGIEAASVAWNSLGWHAAWLAEIEPFPSALLAHHYPDVPNLGDMTALPERIAAGEIEAPDILCGGTPCQAFSVAGLRRSLDDARGNLSLTFCEIANAIDISRARSGLASAVIVWENVPGVLSTRDNAFGCFLAGLAGEDGELVAPGGKWPNAGCVYGPQRAVAWRVFDAQYFGLAQRRRRVFVVASARDGFDSAAILLEFEGLRRDSSPRREKGQKIAPTIAGCSNGGGSNGPGRDVDSVESLQVVVMAHGQGGAEIAIDRSPTLTCIHKAPIVAHALRGEGFDASEDGTGRGTPLVVCHAFDARQSDVIQYGDITGPLDTDGHSVGVLALDTTQITSAANRSAPKVGDPCHPLAAGAHAPAIAFSCKDYGADAGELSPTLRAMNHSDSHSNGGGQVAVITPPAMQVRRLTPRECERLQGFPTVSEKAIIEVCIDHQNRSASVALKCHKWQNSAWPADASGLTQPASIAGIHSSMRQAGQEPLAALHVQLLYGHKVRVTRNAGRSILYASGAEAFEKFHPSTPIESIAAELAPLLHELVSEALSGRAASHHSIRLSFPVSSGATSAEKSGQGTEARASGAENDQRRGTFTTSDLGQITSHCGSTAATLCCSVLRAIAGCIPSETLPARFSIELTVESPYTAIPYRKKTAEQCPDGPRYKALGNSMAVPVMRWIGERIALAISILESGGGA